MIEERTIRLEASDVNEALSEASRQWKIPVEELSAEVVSEGREGFLGLFGSKKLLVEVKATTRPDLMTRAIEFVDETLRLMGFEAEVGLSETEKNMIDIKGNDASDYVVGRYGDCLKAMEYLVNLALRDPKVEPRIKVDACGYRERRTKSLERLAEATARQAVKFGRPVRLDPMASWERWVIHNALKSRDDVTTESIGEQPTRKVVVIPKYEAEPARPAGPASMRVRAQKERIERSGRDIGTRSQPRRRSRR